MREGQGRFQTHGRGVRATGTFVGRVKQGKVSIEEARLFQDSAGDPGFTGPTDKTSLMSEGPRPQFGEDRVKRLSNHSEI